MRILLAFAVLVTLSACKRNDKFFQEKVIDGDPRYNQNYKLDSSTSETYAVDVDILWVIDNSGSMGSYQQQVIDNSTTFIQQFTTSSRLQWKMGLISTDEIDPPYAGFSSPLDYQTLNPAQIFNSAVAMLGTLGSGEEKAFTPTLGVLNRYTNFMRPGAYLIQIFVSDEYEQSYISTAQFLSNMKTKMGGDLSKYIAYGVYSYGSNDSWNNKYNEVVQQTNGKVYSLDSQDFGVLLADMGKDLVQKVTTVYPIVLLDKRPIIGTIQVLYKGRILIPGTDWVYNATYNYVEIRNTSVLDNKVLDINISFQVDRS